MSMVSHTLWGEKENKGVWKVRGRGRENRAILCILLTTTTTTKRSETRRQEGLIK